MHKTLNLISKLKSSKQFWMYVAVTVLTFLFVQYIAPHLTEIMPIVLGIEIFLIVTITWGMAVDTVMKSLFGVGAGLSLVIYLAQSYCEASVNAHTGDSALRLLIASSLIYMGIQFFWSLYKDASAKAKKLKEIEGKGESWLISVPYALFTGLFTWQVIQVMTPIIQSLCIYQ